MTGDQGALFDAPTMAGQAALFGGTYLAADELDELAASAAELARRDPPATERQRQLAAARHADVIAHRRECGNCIPGHLCRQGKTAEREYRQAMTVLSAMERGEL